MIAISSADTGGALTGLFLAGYIGMALPVVALGLIMQSLPLVLSVVIFGAVMLALIVVTAFALIRTRLSGTSVSKAS